MEKKNNSLVIILMGVIIIILSVLCVLFATETIKLKSNESSSNNENNKIINEKDNAYVNDSKNQNNEENNWGDYILNQHLLEAKIATLENSYSIEKNDVNDIINTLKTKKLIKVYSNGRGSIIDGKDLIIDYENNNNKYSLHVSVGASDNYCEIYPITNLNDEYKNILEKNVISEKNPEMKDNAFNYFYEIDNCSNTIFDKYTK